MHRLLLFITVIATVIVAAVSGSANGKDCVSLFGNVSAEKPAIESMFADRPGWPDSLTEASGTYIRPLRDIGLQDMAGQSSSFALSDYLVRGQGGGEGGAGAAAATDPSAILIQFQIQNVFTPSTYDASGYSNSLILQPVLPFPIAMPGLKHVFPDHIIRPTLPVIRAHGRS